MDDTIFDAISSFKYLSGVGEKSAQRYVNDLLDMQDYQLEAFISAMNNLQKIKRCSVCNNFAVNDVCTICNENRNTKSLIIVSDASDISLIDNLFDKQYDFHVLGGIIDPLKGKHVEDLSFSLLDKRVSNYDEFIITLATTTQGELTANYINESYKDSVKISKLAQGVPLGGSVSYLDELTLYKAINDRQKFEE